MSNGNGSLELPATVPGSVHSALHQNGLIQVGRTPPPPYGLCYCGQLGKWPGCGGSGQLWTLTLPRWVISDPGRRKLPM